MKAMVLAASMLALTAVETSAGDIGLRDVMVRVAEREADVSVAIWYPAGSGGELALVGDNRVFQGVGARRGATLAEGRFPVILLAHGGLRSAPGVDSWIASTLAHNGYVVAVPHPPSRELKAQDAPKEVWLRPADLSATLDALASDTALASSIDFTQVSAVGFLLGGTSVLALAGAQLDAKLYAASCDMESSNRDCDWFEQAGVDLREVDADKLGASHLDPRIRVVIAVEPELSEMLVPGNLSNAPATIDVVTLGSPSTTTIDPAPNVTQTAISGATPFDSFSECKPGALTILQQEGDTRICENGGLPRGEAHKRLADMILVALDPDLR